MSLIRELLEQMAADSESGDPALDQQIQDIRKRTPDQTAAAAQIDAARKQRMSQVSPRIRALMQRKRQFNQQINQQIEQARQQEQQQS